MAGSTARNLLKRELKELTQHPIEGFSAGEFFLRILCIQLCFFLLQVDGYALACCIGIAHNRCRALTGSGHAWVAQRLSVPDVGIENRALHGVSVTRSDWRRRSLDTLFYPIMRDVFSACHTLS